MIVRICGLLFMLLIASGTFSQTDPFRSSEISISLNDIYEVDVEEGKARINIDIHVVSDIWFDMPAFPKLKILNAQSDKENIDTLGVYYGDAYNEFIVNMTLEVFNTFDFTNYPLDTQHVRFVARVIDWREKLKVNPVNLNQTLVKSAQGWELTDMQFTQMELVSGTVAYDQIVMSIGLTRKHRFMHFLKLYLPTLISLMVIYIGFFLSADQVESRFTISVGSLFVIISNMIIIQQSIASTGTFTLLEKLNLVSLVSVTLIILAFALSFYRYKREKPTKRFETYSLLISVGVYLAGALLLIGLAL